MGRYDAREAGYHSDDDNNGNHHRDPSFLTRKNGSNYQNTHKDIIETAEREKSTHTFLSVTSNRSLCDDDDHREEESICSDTSTGSSYSVAISVKNTCSSKRSSTCSSYDDDC